ncbi:MAG TPA: formylmethanofuran dehydrogenase [Nitrospirae bacterium]|nr:formylmethanofuran dehydrogenase [Nitrospirota bacterium]
MDFDDVVRFHGHACPGLALGYRVSQVVLREFGSPSEDEELVAVVENNSCAVDAVQVLTGCTFGKGNLIFRDYGKQVYTFIKRPSGDALRISVKWVSPEESEEEKDAWRRYSRGERSDEVLEIVHSRKARKIKAIMEAPEEELFDIRKTKMQPPPEARIYPSLRCEACGEKVMEPRARIKEGKILCIPCSELKVET